MGKGGRGHRGFVDVVPGGEQRGAVMMKELQMVMGASLCLSFLFQRKSERGKACLLQFFFWFGRILFG